MNEKPCDQKRIKTFPKGVLKGKVFEFAQIDIEVPDELYGNLSEIAPLLVVQEIPDCNIPEEVLRKKLVEKQSRKQKGYWVLRRQKRSFCTHS